MSLIDYEHMQSGLGNIVILVVIFFLKFILHFDKRCNVYTISSWGVQCIKTDSLW